MLVSGRNSHNKKENAITLLLRLCFVLPLLNVSVLVPPQAENYAVELCVQWFYNDKHEVSLP